MVLLPPLVPLNSVVIPQRKLGNQRHVIALEGKRPLQTEIEKGAMTILPNKHPIHSAPFEPKYGKQTGSGDVLAGRRMKPSRDGERGYGVPRSIPREWEKRV